MVRSFLNSKGKKFMNKGIMIKGNRKTELIQSHFYKYVKTKVSDNNK